MVQTFDTDFYIALLLEACHNFTQTSHRISHRISQDLHEDSNGASMARWWARSTSRGSRTCVSKPMGIFGVAFAAATLAGSTLQSPPWQ